MNNPYYTFIMKDGIEGRRTVRPLDWRALVPKAIAQSFDSLQTDEEGNLDHEKFRDIAMTLDMLAQEAAHRGIDFERAAAPVIDEINRQLRDGKITEGQAEFMRDEHDALLQMINWAFAEGIIDEDTKITLHEAVN